MFRCIDPAVSAQARLLKHKPQQAFAYPGPGGAAGGYKSQSSRQSRGWRVAGIQIGGGARIGL